jgi:hypothetical protein
MTIGVLVGSNVPVTVDEGERDGEGVEGFNITTGRDAVGNGDSKISGATAGGRYWEIQTTD